MASSFFGLNIARSGMSAYNAKLNTTAHNIANVHTKGYSRQVAKQEATIAISLGTSYGMIGTGTEVSSIDSQRDFYYDNKFRINNSIYAKYDTLSYYMESIEDCLYTKDASSGGMTNSLDSFFKTLTGLTTDPSSTTIRTQVAGYADTFCRYIQETADTLRTLQEDVNTQIADTVDQINAYAEEIASLNKQINTVEVYGNAANDLRDRRATIIDELSSLVDIQVYEKEPANGEGLNQFLVYIDGAVLVDTNDYNTIKYEAQSTLSSCNDADNLYKLTWSTGTSFGSHDTTLGGKLQALFQLRDGNNGEVFTGKTTATAGDTTLVVTDVNELGSSIFKLDIPAGDGVVRINNTEYEYESFDVEVTDGVYTYTFNLKEEVKADVAANTDVKIGNEVDYRGVPYYMSQLNEFIRTFSYRFNEVQTDENGRDLNGNRGTQMFLGCDTVTGNYMRFDAITDADGKANFTFSSVATTDTDGDGYDNSSYYRLTALNTAIDPKILKDGSLIACALGGSGVSNGENLARMSALESDTTMFRQGQPNSFIQVLTSTVGVDSKKVSVAAENAMNIKDAVDNRRLSIAGVDEDEEAQNLIMCQNLLNYQYKVLSVMNEVLDKLINGTAV